jgi:FkbM family methyltransferase
MSFKKFVKRWLYSRCPGLAGSFPYFGTKIYFPPGSLIFSMVMNSGIFEYDNYVLIRQWIRPNSTYFDVGSNIGVMAIPFLKENPTCFVASFEPSPLTYSFLQRTHADSGYAERWRVSKKALSDRKGVSQFTLSMPGLEAFDGFRPTGRVPARETVSVEVGTLDDEWEALGCPAVSVIKCDVEGAEIQVLRGAARCLKEQRPAVITEWNATNIQAYDCPTDAILNFASSMDYRVFSISSNSHAVPSLLEINHRDQLEGLQALGMDNVCLLPNTLSLDLQDRA